MNWRRREFLLAGFAGILRAAGLDKNAIGANTAMAGYSLYQAIDAIRHCGFPVIEIHPMGVVTATPGKFPGFEFDTMPDASRRKLRQALAGFRRITTHLPYSGLSPFSPDRKTADESVRKIAGALDATAYVGAELAVLHVVPPKEVPFAEVRTAAIQRIREWGDFAAAHRFKIGIETGFPRSIAEFTAFVQAVNHEAVGCTIDVGHQGRYAELMAKVKPEDRGTPAGIRAYNDTTHAIIDGLPGKVLHFHVHDIDPATWQEHRPIGTGFVDYPRLIAKLRKINYAGVLMLEIAGPGSEIESLVADSKRRLEAYL
jgi:sugar phosphate isomerase/epimerase